MLSQLCEQAQNSQICQPDSSIYWRIHPASDTRIPHRRRGDSLASKLARKTAATNPRQVL